MRQINDHPNQHPHSRRGYNFTWIRICESVGVHIMTTLKEYKAMMEGATDALAFVCRTLGWLEVVPPYGDKVDRTKECDKAIIECVKVRDALNKHTDLIRVIELAEYALDRALQFKTSEGQENIVKQVLSEIKKLKGEYMTNELGTTLSDIEAKAERKREALRDWGFINQIVQGQLLNLGHKRMESIRKYIEEN